MHRWLWKAGENRFNSLREHLQTLGVPVLCWPFACDWPGWICEHDERKKMSEQKCVIQAHDLCTFHIHYVSPCNLNAFLLSEFLLLVYDAPVILCTLRNTISVDDSKADAPLHYTELWCLHPRSDSEMSCFCLSLFCFSSSTEGISFSWLRSTSIKRLWSEDYKEVRNSGHQRARTFQSRWLLGYFSKMLWFYLFEKWLQSKTLSCSISLHHPSVLQF